MKKVSETWAMAVAVAAVTIMAWSLDRDSARVPGTFRPMVAEESKGTPCGVVEAAVVPCHLNLSYAPILSNNTCLEIDGEVVDDSLKLAIASELSTLVDTSKMLSSIGLVGARRLKALLTPCERDGFAYRLQLTVIAKNGSVDMLWMSLIAPGAIGIHAVACPASPSIADIRSTAYEMTAKVMSMSSPSEDRLFFGPWLRGRSCSEPMAAPLP